jgi:penicillin-binding protein 2
LQNKAIQGEYPPASTYKAITAIAALEEGIIDEETTFYCPGQLYFGDREFKCWKKGGHGKVDIYRAISESCDVFFYHVGQKLSVDILAAYARSFGLGERTHIDLDHEANGLIPTKAWKKRRFGIQWIKGENLSIVIGQGYNLVTPLQLAIATSVIANGGTVYKPIILERVETADGRVVKTSQPKVVRRLTISKQTLDMVKKGLWQVVNSARGTARRIRIKGVEVSGKTGTAQVFSRKKDDTEEMDEENLAKHLKPHAWFMAYAPSENPRIAVSVIVEHGEHGSSMAAPIAKGMIETFLKKEKSLPKGVAKR